MTDHKEEAEAQTKVLAPLWAAMRDDTIPEGAVKALVAISALAQVHATLYLAEQTRLANLIQWAGITNNHKGYAAEIEEGLRT